MRQIQIKKGSVGLGFSQLATLAAILIFAVLMFFVMRGTLFPTVEDTENVSTNIIDGARDCSEDREACRENPLLGIGTQDRSADS